MAKKKLKKRKPARRASKAPKWSAITFDQLERERSSKGLTIQGMAEHLGISYGTYRNWKSGEAVPNLNRQRQLAAKLKPSPTSKSKAVRGRVRRVTDEQVSAAGSLVCAYTRSQKGKLTPEELVQTVRKVISAVSGT